MKTEKKAKINELLKSLCINNGWSYGVFWSFDQRNSMVLTEEGAYFENQMGEDQMGISIDDMLLQVHILGDGIIGNAALEKRNQWIFAEKYHQNMDPLVCIKNHEIFQDESKIHLQFSSRIETIAIISVEPHGVVQFGSTLKILETLQFVDQTKLLIQEIVKCGELELPEFTSSVSIKDIHKLSNLHSPPVLSSFSGIVDTVNRASSYNYLALNGLSIDILNTRPITLYPTAIEFSDIQNQFNMTSTDSQYSQLNDFSFNSPEFLIDFPSNSLSNSVIENDIFPNLDVNFDFGEIENVFDDISMPLVSGSGLDFNADFSGCISHQCVESVLSPRESLFSKLGIDQCLDGMTCKSFSFAASSSDSKQPSKLSSAIQRKRENLSDSQSCGSSFVSQAKRSEESVNVVKKRSKPGSRPKPKDRQQIQDRIAELRKLIPNGVKMSIDFLLAQTIKYMIFWESMTKHADNLKNAKSRKDNDYISTWEFEDRVQSMVEPVDVKDLSLAGQKHIKILCKEEGFFLEIVDIIQGLGLTILQGVMELREDKIWARFIVESEEKHYVSKQDVYLSLHQLLSQKVSCGINLCDQLANNCMYGGGSNLFDNYHQYILPFCEQAYGHGKIIEVDKRIHE